MHDVRRYHVAALLPNGLVLVAGGVDSNGAEDVLLSSAELYDPKTGAFSTTGPMETGREFFTATTLGNGDVLVVGGSSQASAELYRP